MNDRKLIRTALLVLGTLAIHVPEAVAIPRLRLVDRDRVVLTVRPMSAQPAPGAPAEIPTRELEDQGVEFELRLAWPAPESVTTVQLRASPRPPTAGLRNVVLLEADVTSPDGSVTHARREFAFDESTTSLFEVYRADGRPLILAVEAIQERETMLTAQFEPGEPIRLQLEVQSVSGDNAVSLESNQLNTFVGESVRYSFTFGRPGEVQSVKVRLTPQRLYGELARIVIDVSGTMYDEGKPTIISRTEEWLTTRGSTSSLTVAVGEPPVGYRFLVTPFF